MKQLRLDFERLALLNYYDERIALYAGLSEIEAWRLHFDEVQSRAEVGAESNLELNYVQRRLDEAQYGSQ